jgi:catechol 2,3-dioxygenase-like lactoylglutathione lyase family enzyme
MRFRQEVPEAAFLGNGMFRITQFDHVGLRVTDLEAAQQFYAKLGFLPDPGEESPTDKARGLVNSAGLRIHLIYNGNKHECGNVLMDIPEKWPGYTHMAFIVDDLDALVTWLDEEKIPITEGPSIFGNGRRKVCFIRDADRNVIEFNEIVADGN